MRLIDLDSWPRRALFEHFLQYNRPFSSLCVRVDVTPLMTYCRASGDSRFGVMLHAVMTALNATGPLKQRLINGQPYELELIHPSFTALDERSQSFNFCLADHTSALPAFLANVAQAKLKGQQLSQQGRLFTDEDHRPDLAYVTCLPWLDFTSLEHAYSGQSDDFIPRVAWGKICTSAEGQAQVSVSLTAHHAFVDGLHIAQFFGALDAYIKAL